MEVLGILPGEKKSLSQVVGSWSPDTIEFWHTSRYVETELAMYTSSRYRHVFS